jgi:hypothetical protein
MLAKQQSRRSIKQVIACVRANWNALPADLTRSEDGVM